MKRKNTAIKRDARGRWPKGVSGNPRGKRKRLDLPTGSDFAALVASYAEPAMDKIAARLVKLASTGDSRAIEQVLTLRAEAQRSKSRETHPYLDPISPDLNRLTLDEVSTLHSIMVKASGRPDPIPGALSGTSQLVGDPEKIDALREIREKIRREVESAFF